MYVFVNVYINKEQSFDSNGVCLTKEWPRGHALALLLTAKLFYRNSKSTYYHNSIILQTGQRRTEACLVGGREEISGKSTKQSV